MIFISPGLQVLNEMIYVKGSAEEPLHKMLVLVSPPPVFKGDLGIYSAITVNSKQSKEVRLH